MVNKKTIAIMCSLGVATAAFCLMGAVTKADTEFEQGSETEESVEVIETDEAIESYADETETIEYMEPIETSESVEITESVEETEWVEEEVQYDEYGCWKIVIYTDGGVEVYIADTPMARDSYIALSGDYSYEVYDPINPLAYIDRMTPEEAGVFYRDFFEIRGISAEQILNCDEDVFNSVMAEWDYAGERAGMDANDLV